MGIVIQQCYVIATTHRKYLIYDITYSWKEVRWLNNVVGCMRVFLEMLRETDKIDANNIFEFMMRFDVQLLAKYSESYEKLKRMQEKA